MASMAACAHTSSYHHASGFMAVSGENSNTLLSFLPSPAAQVVLGEQEPFSASSFSSPAMSIQDKAPFFDCSDTLAAHSPLARPPENSNSGDNSDESHVETEAENKTPALNEPSNGVDEIGPVMEGVALLALSESADAVPDVQGEAFGSTSTAQDSASPLHPHNQLASHATNNSRSKQAMSRGIPGNGGGVPAHGGFFRPSQAPVPARSTSQVPRDNHGRPFGGNLARTLPDNNRHGTSWRGNFNSNNHNYSAHRNNEHVGGHVRGRFMNNGSVHMHQIPHPRTPWMHSTSSPYMPPPNSFPPHPLTSHADHMFHPGHYGGQRSAPHHPDIQFISLALVSQINYYFSDANLVGDSFLKSHMDDQGWVSIYLVANFPRVLMMTNDINFILYSLRSSLVIEVAGDKIRRRHEWSKWLQNKNPTPTS